VCAYVTSSGSSAEPGSLIRRDEDSTNGEAVSERCGATGVIGSISANESVKLPPMPALTSERPGEVGVQSESDRSASGSVNGERGEL
jgi:hypothetical protein